MSGADVKLHQYSCSREIMARAAALGLKPDALGDMLRKSARITHPHGNRRYHDFVFLVEGRELKAVSRMEPEESVPVDSNVAVLERELSKLQKLLASANDALRFCTAQVERFKKQPPSGPVKRVGCTACNDTGRQKVYDACPDCDTGCDKCDQGLVESSIPCPACVHRRDGKLVIRNTSVV